MSVKNTTVIIPIHTIDEEIKKLLDRAVNSIDKKRNDIIIVGPNEVLKNLETEYDYVDFVFNEDTDLFVQINKAVMQCSTEFFTVLEFDDILLENWNDIMESEIGNNSVLLPINEVFNFDKNEFICFGNEIMWDAAFVREEGKLGDITIDELKGFKDFNVTGGLIKTETFISIGKLKPEFKLTAWYEFLMRMLKSDKSVYVVPRVCYRHFVGRNGSYGVEIKEKVTPEEFKELLDKIND